jgi:hypothetical protein
LWLARCRSGRPRRVRSDSVPVRTVAPGQHQELAVPDPRRRLPTPPACSRTADMAPAIECWCCALAVEGSKCDLDPTPFFANDDLLMAPPDGLEGSVGNRSIRSLGIPLLIHGHAVDVTRRRTGCPPRRLIAVRTGDRQSRIRRLPDSARSDQATGEAHPGRRFEGQGHPLPHERNETPPPENR